MCCAECKLLVYADFKDYAECSALGEFMTDDKIPDGRREDCPLVKVLFDKDYVRRVRMRMANLQSVDPVLVEFIKKLMNELYKSKETEE